MIKKLSDHIKEINDFKKQCQAVFIFKSYEPRNLRIVIEGITDYTIKEFYIRLSCLTKSHVSSSQYKIIKKYLDAEFELFYAKQDLIKLLTNELN